MVIQSSGLGLNANLTALGKSLILSKILFSHFKMSMIIVPILLNCWELNGVICMKPLLYCPAKIIASQLFVVVVTLCVSFCQWTWRLYIQFLLLWILLPWTFLYISPGTFVEKTSKAYSYNGMWNYKVQYY